MSNCTVEKIGGTSMSRFQTVLKHIIIGDRKGKDLYNRVFVVSAYSGITNMLLEHKKQAEPGVFTYYTNDDDQWQKQLIKVKGQMLEINKGFKGIGLDLSAANDFVEKRINETIVCLSDLIRLCSYGHFSREEFIPAVRELLSSIGEAHSAFNTTNILNNNGINAVFVDLTGWKDERKFPVAEVVAKAFADMGFKIYATAHTADVLKASGVNATVLYKVNEAQVSPNILDYLQERKIDLVINVPVANRQTSYSDILTDGYIIRRQAVEFNVPVITNLQLAAALVEVLKQKGQNGNSIRSLNEYMDDLPWKLW